MSTSLSCCADTAPSQTSRTSTDNPRRLQEGRHRPRRAPCDRTTARPDTRHPRPTATVQNVDITADFTRPELDYPEGTVAQLFRNDEALGEPVPMPDTGNSLTFTAEVPREQQTKSVTYEVELVSVKVDSDEWTGTTANPPTILVKGTGVTAPEPTTGSLQFGSLESAFTASLSELSGYELAPLSNDNLTGMLSSAF